jgi:NAD(P)-dependent dehydrogenase (short-subunit alcohol dehydrogenase family)
VGYSYEEKVVVITGASSGIGRAAAFDLAERGAVICATARREEQLKELVEALPGDGHSYRVCDVSDRERVRALARHVEETHGRCDVLINNAGFSRYRPLDADDSVEALESVMATNFLGAVYCTKELLPLLAAARPGHVVNIASVAGRIPLGGNAAYSASKFALVGWSESMYSELAGRGVYVGSVEPGPVPTEGFPQTGMVGHPVFRYGLATTTDVTKAIRNVIEKRKIHRTVPRAYYLVQFLRIAAPKPWRVIQDFVIGARNRHSGQ